MAARRWVKAAANVRTRRPLGAQQLGRALAKGALGIAVLLTACSRRSDGEAVATTRQTLPGTLSITLSAPHGVAPTAPVLECSDTLALASRANVTGTVVALGTDSPGLSAAHAVAISGDAWSRSLASLASAVQIGGTLHASQVQTAAGDSIGATDSTPVIDPVSTLAWNVAYPPGTANDVSLSSGVTQTLPPGLYGSVSASAGANLQPSGRVVSPGYSGFGWSFRTVGPGGPGPWTHDHFQTPLSIGWDSLWGDPSIASNDGLPGFVFAGTLAIPHSKFVDYSNSMGTPGTIQGVVSGTVSPIGGGCVFRSMDGGQHFSIVDCVRDTSDEGVLFDADGHFYDGGNMVLAQAPGGGSGFTAYVAFIDWNKKRQAVWTMLDATSTAAHPLQPDSTVVGNVGPLAGFELGEIETHVRLAASGSKLFEMSVRSNGPGVSSFNARVGFNPADLEVNFRGNNSNAIALAENAEWGLNVLEFPAIVRRTPDDEVSVAA